MRQLLLILILLINFASQAAIYYVDSSITDTYASSATPDFVTYNPVTFATTGGTASVYNSLADINLKTKVAGDQILFRKGQLWYGSIAVGQSGTVGNKITYGAYGTGANPIITGFTTLSGWIDEGGGIWSKVITSEAQTNMVTIDGVQYGMGRYPNTTYLTYTSQVTNVSITDNTQTGTPNWTGAELVIAKNGYILDRCLISSQSTGTFNYTNLGSVSSDIKSTGNYFIQNSIAVLDSYGEWYHNTATGKFSMYFGGIIPSTKTIKVATLNYLVKPLAQEDYININNISFTGSINDAIYLIAANDYISIENTSVTFAGLDCIHITGIQSKVKFNNLSDCNRIAIHLSGINDTIANNTITNNAFIVGQGNITAAYKGAIYVSNTNCYIANNSIINCGYNGIFMAAAVMTAQVKNNYIYNSCLHRPDQGGIYLDGVRTSVLIESNVIIKSGGNGIYLDEYTANTFVQNNTISECLRNGIFLHKSSNNSIVGNVCYDNSKGICFENWLDEDNLVSNIVTGNSFVAKIATQYTLSFTTRYTGYATSFATLTMSNNYYARPIDDNNSIHTNFPLIYDQYKTLAQWQTITGKDANSSISPKTVTLETDLAIVYNETNAAKTVTAPFEGIDVAGTQYGTSIVLQPYTSKVLIRNAAPVNGLFKPWVVNGKTWVVGGKNWGRY